MEVPVEVIVTIDDDSLDYVPKVVDGLKRAGLDVVNVLELTGQVVGNWPKTVGLQRLNDVEGVLEAVESGEMKAI